MPTDPNANLIFPSYQMDFWRDTALGCQRNPFGRRPGDRLSLFHMAALGNEIPPSARAPELPHPFEDK
jgi:hypothetical protein